nr:pentatricopeptide repeat-containing protein At2g27610 [Malus domestica]
MRGSKCKRLRESMTLKPALRPLTQSYTKPAPKQYHFAYHTNHLGRPHARAVFVSSAFVFGNVEENSNFILDPVVTCNWTALITGTAEWGESMKFSTNIEKEDCGTQCFGCSYWVLVGAVKLLRLGSTLIVMSQWHCVAAPTSAVEQGKQFHACSIKLRLENTLCLSSALVTMYAKMGNIESANEVFKRQGERDLVHGTQLSLDMLNMVTGRRCKCWEFWSLRITAIRMGKLAAEKLISLQPHDSAAYVLLSNIYAAAGNWQERAKVRKLMDERKVKKQPGYSWIEGQIILKNLRVCGDCHNVIKLISGEEGIIVGSKSVFHIKVVYARGDYA